MLLRLFRRWFGCGCDADEKITGVLPGNWYAMDGWVEYTCQKCGNKTYGIVD